MDTAAHHYMCKPTEMEHVITEPCSLQENQQKQPVYHLSSCSSVTLPRAILSSVCGSICTLRICIRMNKRNKLSPGPAK